MLQDVRSELLDRMAAGITVADIPELPAPTPVEPAYVARLEKRIEQLEDTLLLNLGVTPSARFQVTVADVVTWVSFQTGVSVNEIMGPRRLFATVRARFAVYWISVYGLQRSLPEIGQKLSNRDHTTVLHGHRRAEEMREIDPAFKMMTDKGLRHFIALIADAIIASSEAALAAAGQLPEEEAN